MFPCAGDIDLSDILASIDGQIEKAKEEAVSRKEILEKVDKWRHAKEEEKWLDDYEKTISYMAERIVGQGSSRIVFQAKCLETGETVAIKKVLQDKRYKNPKSEDAHDIC